LDSPLRARSASHIPPGAAAPAQTIESPAGSESTTGSWIAAPCAISTSQPERNPIERSEAAVADQPGRSPIFQLRRGPGPESSFCASSGVRIGAGSLASGSARKISSSAISLRAARAVPRKARIFETFSCVAGGACTHNEPSISCSTRPSYSNSGAHSERTSSITRPASKCSPSSCPCAAPRRGSTCSSYSER
jgi:hypothetical protein